jgi:hypothetical protein
MGCDKVSFEAGRERERDQSLLENILVPEKNACPTRR